MIPELDPETDLSFTRALAVPRQLVWDCWTQPEHIPHFFIPAPHRVTSVEIDLRVGGRFNTTFDVDGAVMDNKGVYLDVVPGEKLVFTDAYTEGWKPAPEPFMTAILLLADAPGVARPIPLSPATETRIPARSMKTWASSMAGARSRRNLKPMPGA